MPINMKKDIVCSAAALARQLHRGQVDKVNPAKRNVSLLQNEM